MSRMLQALEKLSDQPREPADDSSAVARDEDASQVAENPRPDATRDDPRERMKELLARHLHAPSPADILKHLRAELNLPDAPANQTVPVSVVPIAPEPPPKPLVTLESLARWDVEPSVRESVSITFPMQDGRASGEPSVSLIAEEERVSALLAGVGAEPESAEEVAVTFAAEPQPQEPIAEPSSSAEPLPQEPAAMPASPAELQPSQPAVVSLPPVEAVDAAPLPAVESSLETLESNAAIVESASSDPPPEASGSAPSSLSHLADERPRIETRAEAEDAPPTPPALVLPPRTIHRSKTRLEQRVIDNLADPAHSAPYREFADRLAQDLRLLAGRCLFFPGIGPASHGDDLLAHLGALMAEENAEVLLVDADFARAGLTVGLGALKEAGLGDMLESSGRDEELLLPTLLPNVSLLPAGRKALPDSLGVVDQLAQLLARLEERFALILIDGGIHSHSPSVPLARLADATYFVIHLGATDARQATTALKAFRGCGARVMGCVATKAA